MINDARNMLIAAIDDDDASHALREMLIATDPDTICSYNDDDIDFDDDLLETMIEHANRLHDAYQLILAEPDNRDILTEIALALSLCPLHLCDYAICFDDENDECATIRLIHPSHDT